MGRRFNIPNQTNTMRLKDKAAPLVTTKEIMPYQKQRHKTVPSSHRSCSPLHSLFGAEHTD